MRVGGENPSARRPKLDSIFPPEQDPPERVSEGSPDAARPAANPGIRGGGPARTRRGWASFSEAPARALNRTVALKLALAGAYAARASEERFQREAEAVAALRPRTWCRSTMSVSPKVAPTSRWSSSRAAVSPRPRNPPRPARLPSILRSLSGALQSAHNAGIIHRDLKPANVLLDEDGTPKISDFGLSRRIDDAASLTLNGAVIGTPSYMAPEQAAGDRAALGAAVDIYALRVRSSTNF